MSFRKKYIVLNLVFHFDELQLSNNNNTQIMLTQKMNYLKIVLITWFLCLTLKHSYMYTCSEKIIFYKVMHNQNK